LQARLGIGRDETSRAQSGLAWLSREATYLSVVILAKRPGKGDSMAGTIFDCFVTAVEKRLRDVLRGQDDLSVSPERPMADDDDGVDGCYFKGRKTFKLPILTHYLRVTSQKSATLAIADKAGTSTSSRSAAVKDGAIDALVVHHVYKPVFSEDTEQVTADLYYGDARSYDKEKKDIHLIYIDSMFCVHKFGNLLEDYDFETSSPNEVSLLNFS
jgi:hypothetical protein